MSNKAARRDQDIERAHARAAIVAAWVRVRLDHQVFTTDLEHRALEGTSLEALLAEEGLHIERLPVAQPGAQHWPAYAEGLANAGGLVLSEQGGILNVLAFEDPRSPRQISRAEFMADYSGTLLIAQPIGEVLSARGGVKGRGAHWFWSALIPFRGWLAIISIGSLTANLLALGVALFALQVYDRVIPHENVATLTVLTIGVILAVLLEAVIRIARAQLIDKAGRDVDIALSERLVGRLLGMRLDARPMAPAQLVSSLRETAAIREFFTTAASGALTDLPFLLLFLVVIATIGGPLVLSVIVGGFLMLLPGLLMRKRMARLMDESLGSSSRAGMLYQEIVYHPESIRALGAEPRYRHRVMDVVRMMGETGSEQRRIGAMLASWAGATQQITYVLMVVAGAFMVFAGQFQVGSIVALSILTGRTLSPLSQLSSILSRWAMLKTAMLGLGQIAEAEQTRDDKRQYLRRPNLNGRYGLEKIRFSHDPDGPPDLLLDGLVFQPGQITALLGGNGAGKSTLLRLLAGHIRPQDGLVTLDHVAMSQIDPDDLDCAIGWMPGEIRLFAGSLRDNLAPSERLYQDEKLMTALDFAGLGAVIRDHPKGLDMIINDGGTGLSAGQRQSVGWARLWLQDPRILLLDEPTSALDTTLETQLVERLKPWLANKMAVIATHRMTMLPLCQRTLVLHRGRLAMDGPRDSVLRHISEAKESH